MIYTVKIYSLSDENDNVFYIGSTINRLDIRLNNHKSDARTNKGKNLGKNEIIRSLNYKFFIKEIDSIKMDSHSGHEAQRRSMPLETYWILYYRDLGFKLCNVFCGYEIEGNKRKIRRA